MRYIGTLNSKYMTFWPLRSLHNLTPRAHLLLHLVSIHLLLKGAPLSVVAAAIVVDMPVTRARFRVMAACIPMHRPFSVPELSTSGRQRKTHHLPKILAPVMRTGGGEHVNEPCVHGFLLM